MLKSSKAISFFQLNCDFSPFVCLFDIQCTDLIGMESHDLVC